MNAGNNAAQNHNVADLLHFVNGMMVPVAEPLPRAEHPPDDAPRLDDAPFLD
jgi:hypothetical protein